MQEFIVVKTAPDTDLGGFSRYLWQHKLPHRIVVEDGEQLLLVGSEENAAQVSHAYRLYQSGHDELPTLRRSEDESLSYLQQRLRAAPVTLMLLVLSLLGFVLVELDPTMEYVRWLTFFPFERHAQGIVFSLPEGEYWRLITPIFLHFSWLHIVFNTLWLWDLGGRIEHIQGSDRMIGIAMVLGLGSNIAQAAFEVGVFGGMSGVVYGLLGYGWIWSVLCPKHSVGIPRAVLVFMLVWLVLGMLGAARLLGAGAVANAAHAGGLIMGMILGLCAGLLARARGRA